MLQVTAAVRKGGCSHCSSQGHRAQLTDFTTGIKGKFACSGISHIKQTHSPSPQKKEVPTPSSGEVPMWERGERQAGGKEGRSRGLSSENEPLKALKCI